MKRNALAFVFLGLAIACVLIVSTRTKPEQRQALLQREGATFVMGEYLTHKYPQEKVVIASNPFTQFAGRPREIYQYENAGLTGLRRALRGKVSYKIVFPELRPGARENPESFYLDSKSTTPLSFLVADNAFDKLFRENPKYQVCVSLIGLPAGILQTDGWRDKNLKFALLFPDWQLIGSSETIRNAFKSGKIAAAVVNRPDLPPELKSNERNYHKIFEQRFLLITAANCDELMNRYRRLF